MESFALRLQSLSLQLVPFVMAVVFHEFAHGFAANRCGDNTAKTAGRLTLNPLPHLDPIGTVLFPLVNMLTGMNLLFGWARPVPINPNRFRKYRPGLFFVSFAGPLMNILLAVLSAAVFWSLQVWVPQAFYLHEPLSMMANESVKINFALAVFNLIPLPPLDGSKIVESFLPYQAAMKYEAIARYSFFILMALLLTGGLSFLAYPISFLYNATFYLVGWIFGVAPGL
jgi:Zn-dependent protease